MDRGIDEAVIVHGEKRDQALDQLHSVVLRHLGHKIRQGVSAVVEDGLDVPRGIVNTFEHGLRAAEEPD